MDYKKIAGDILEICRAASQISKALHIVLLVCVLF